MKLWSERFLAHARGMAVFHPAFEKYNPKWDQCFCYISLAELTKSALVSTINFTKAEKHFLSSIIVESWKMGRWFKSNFSRTQLKEEEELEQPKKSENGNPET